MAIKNFFFTRSWILCGLLLVGCAELQTRDQVNKTASTPTTSESRTTPITETSSALPPAAISTSSHTRPKIGVVFGPGGMKTFAQLGFLEQLEKARIPIDYVTGLEWGSLVAGLYSIQGKAYDAQWKMLKMTERDLPRGGIFDSQARIGTVDALNNFFANTIGHQMIERAAVPFSCPAQSTQTGVLTWYATGPMARAVQHCLPYPPLFSPQDNLSAATFALKEAADQLRRQGATVVILIDVLADGGMMNMRTAQENYPLYLLWLSIQTQVRNAHGIFDDVFSINVRDKGLTDFASRRSLVQAGEVAGQGAVQTLTRKYGL